MHDFGVYEVVPRAASRGKKFISVRWSDVNKGDLRNLSVRSRLCGREFKWLDPFMNGTFAATPPLEALRYALSFAMTIQRKHGRRLEIVILIIDVSRAHLHSPAERELYIELPVEERGCHLSLSVDCSRLSTARETLVICLTSMSIHAFWTQSTLLGVLHRASTSTGWRKLWAGAMGTTWSS